MPILKASSRVDEYRLRALNQNPHHLSGRGEDVATTDYVNAEIRSRLDIGTDANVIDIGCGDGSLLRILAAQGACCTGLLPSDEEVQLVAAALRDTSAFDITIQRGLATATGLPDACCDIVICNGVLVLLENDAVELALEEIARIARPGAQVFLGEIPTRDEFEGRNYSDSILSWLWWTLRNRGFMAFSRAVTSVLRAWTSAEVMVIAPKTHFYCSEQVFINLARGRGLELVETAGHRLIATDGSKVDIGRVNYLFKKFEAGSE
jgi:2-polyprenyl-3-methyl-5-hydroxy-6-metoxy-1,4-benzoquinol methylase